MPFNWFDVVLVLILALSAVAGLRSGFARVVVGLIATVVGFLAGFWCYRIVAATFMPWVKTATIANLLGFLVIFIGVLILGALIAAVLSRIFKWVGLSWFDHLLGGAAGFVRGVIVVAVLADVIIAFSPWSTPSALQQSRVLPYTGAISSWLAELAPHELKDAFNEQMQNLKRYWATPAHSWQA